MKFFKFLIIIFFIFKTESVIKAEQNNIVIKIDDKIITTLDIKNKIITSLLLSKKIINQENINSLKRRSIEDLIQLNIKKIELEKFNFKKDNKKINSYLNSISENNIQSLKKKFLENNIDFDIFVDEIDVELKWRNFIFQNFENKIQINLEEVDREIKNLKQNNENITEYNLSEIEILSDKNKSKNETIINNIIQEIKDTDFENAVIKFSISSTASNKGRLGWVNTNSLSNEILKILEKMEINDISSPIKKQNRIIFLKLNDKKTFSISEKNIDELKRNIINQKKNDMFRLYSNSYLSQLRNTKYIQYF